MKKINLLLVAATLTVISACSNSQANTWTAEQKSTWTEKCMQFMAQQGVDQKSAIDFCDCMLAKTSEKYTPEEAAAITADEERKLWTECDYNW